MFNLSEALSAIENKPEFVAKDKGEYTVIDYQIKKENTFTGNSEQETKILHNLRGTAFDNTTGEIIRLGYHSFFNFGEKTESDSKLDFNTKHTVTQKIDGSCLFPVKLSTGYILGTRAGDTDIAKLGTEFAKNSEVDYAGFITLLLRLNITPIFEFCSKENRIVIEYPESKLVLTGMRSMTSGSYINYETMQSLALLNNIPVVTNFESTNNTELKTFLNHISNLENDEGVVLKFEEGSLNGHMIKIKSADYCIRHKVKEKFETEANTIQLILNNKLDDTLPLLESEKQKKIKLYAFELISRILLKTAEIELEFSKLQKIDSQKEFAAAITNSSNKSFLFKMRSSEVEPLSLVKEFVKKQATDKKGVLVVKEFLEITATY